MSEPPARYQLQGATNHRKWAREFKTEALAEGVWDVFSGIYVAPLSPDPADYGLDAASPPGTPSKNNAPDTPTKKAPGGKGRQTIGPDDIRAFIDAAASAEADKRKGIDYASRIQLFRYQLDDYDKGRRMVGKALALLRLWVHPALRSQLEVFRDPKEAYDHLLSRYAVSEERAKEIAESKFESIVQIDYRNVQDYVNAIEEAVQDLGDAGIDVPDPRVISKIIRGLNESYALFVSQYHLLREFNDKFLELDFVITQLLTHENTFQLAERRNNNMRGAP